MAAHLTGPLVFVLATSLSLPLPPPLSVSAVLRRPLQIPKLYH